MSAYVSFDVQVVDGHGGSVSGEKVEAQFSYMIMPGTWSTEYTDSDGHASFSSEHPSAPVTVTVWIRGESWGPYSLDDGDAFTIEV